MNDFREYKTRNVGKRIASILMTLLFTFTFIFENQYIAFADSNLSESNTIVDTDMDISGSNSFGNLVADGLMAKNAEQLENNGCNVFSVDMDGTVAAVSFETTSNCSLLVGIYDNDGEAMVAFGSAEVIAKETEAYVDINTDVMPDYFYIRAYLVDTDTLRPLCSEYTSPMYTRSMQEFLSKTTNDFDQSRVMNLDDREDTNFAVFNETTKLIPAVENVNKVVSANVETQEYVFANADENITSLETGDIFAYDYNGEVLIVKVGSVNIDGSNVTITGQDAELEEVFEHLRIDGEALTQTAKVNTDNLEEGITYLGCSEDEPESEVAPYAVDIEGKKSFSQKYEIKKGDKYESDTTKVNYSFSAGLNFSLDASIKVYVSFSEVYFQIKLDYSAKIYAQFEGNISKSFPLAWLEISPCPGVFIRLTPSFVVEFNGTSKLEGKLTGTIGFKASTKSGSQNLTSKPKFTLDGESQITIFVGFSLEPELIILHKNVADAKLTAKVGAEIKATIVKMSTDPDKGMRHDCDSCIDGDVGVKFSVNASVTLFNNSSLTFKIDIFDKTFHLFDFYVSLTYGTAGLTECPHISYLEKVTVLGKNSVPLQNAKITVDENPEVHTTGNNGVAEIWIPQGEHKLNFNADGYKAKLSTVKVSKFKRTIKAKLTLIGEMTTAESIKKFFDDFKNTIKEGASNPENVDYNIPDVEDVPEELRELKIKQVILGSSGHSAAITTSGDLFMWGYGGSDQLGYKTTYENPTPVKIMDNVASVSLGYYYSAAITFDGSLYMWGENNYGQLGDGTTIDKSTPVKIMDNVASISLGDCSTAAITTDGSLYMWGRNDNGTLGDGTTTDKHTPVKIMDNVASVSLASCTAAITNDRSLYMWGSNKWGNFGNGTTDDSYVPVKVMDNVANVELATAFHMARGWGITGVITTDGTLYMCGEWCSDDEAFVKSNVFTKKMDNVTSVKFGVDHCAIITSENSLYLWGTWGFLGNVKPVKVLNNVTYISLSGTGFSGSTGVAISDDNLYIWGRNYTHINGVANDTVHDPIKIMKQISAADLSNRNTAVITKDGILYMWGENEWGQLGNGTTEDSSIPVKVEFPKVPVSEASTYSLRAAPRTAADTETTVFKTFTNLIPNEIYNYYSVKSRAVSDELSADNLLYMGQTVSDENGTLTVPDYVPNGKIFVKAATEFDVYNAEITSTETENKSVSLVWNPVDGASEYEVISYSENGVVSYPKTSGTSISIDNLEPGDYGFVVTSIVYGEQSVPAMNDIVLVHIDEPTKVPTLTVADADGKAKLSWEEIDNVLAYKVYSYEDSEYKLLTFTAENSYMAQDLTIGEKYGFIVSACVNDVWSELNENDVVYITLGSHIHNYGTEWKHDTDSHWHECACGNKTDIASHEFDDDGQCSVCGASMVKQTVLVTFPDSVIVTTALDVIVHNGDEVNTGDKLRIEATVPNGKKLTSLTVNGEMIENGGTYTVGNENIVIKAVFDDITVPPAEKITITIPENVVVKRDDITLNNGDEIHSGDILRIEANVPEGKTLSSLIVNGSEIENGSTYTVDNEDVVIQVAFENIATPPAEKITVSIPENVTVIRDGIAINDGDEIHSGDILRIEATVPEGKTLSSLIVNGSEIENGSTYTVSGDNVVIKVQFKNIETQPTPDIKYTITIPENVKVNRLGSVLKNGDEIREDDNLTITATAPSGYRLSSLTVNGESFSNGDIFTVGKEDVVISASFRKISTGGSSSSGRPSRPGSSSGSSPSDDDQNKDDTPNDPTNPDNPSDSGNSDNPSGSGTSDNPDDKNKTSEQPFLNSNSSISGWDNILAHINDSLTKVISVDMNGTTILPAKILQAIKGKDVKLLLKMDEKISWSIEGIAVEKADQDINLQVTMNTDKIPNDAIRDLVKGREYFTLSLNHNGDFGFNAFLVITVGIEYDNEPINLFWYNNNKFKSEDNSKVQYGMAVLQFTHASDWLVVFGEDKSDTGTSSSDSSTSSDTSQPIDVKPNESNPGESNNSKPTTTESGNPSDDEKDNPHTGSSRVSLVTFLALITSAAVALVTQKRKK